MIPIAIKGAQIKSWGSLDTSDGRTMEFCNYDGPKSSVKVCKACSADRAGSESRGGSG